jgi:cellulose biosynthesis protein BcsQ
LHTFLKENNYRSVGVYTFFSFVDGRKKMHRELAAWARGNFGGVLQSAIPYLSHVEQMGIYRQPVPAFAPASPASEAYQDLWEEICQELLIKRK